ncbi:integrase [Klebsiella pneumoniae]|nr:integrase [Klebsiella pneumoniae]
MLMQHIGVGYFGYYRATAYAMKHSLMPEIAKLRMKALNFWDKHGIRAAADAFDVSTRTLYWWRRLLRTGGPEALIPRSKAPLVRRSRHWHPDVLKEIRRLRTELPNLGKEQIFVRLKPWCEARHFTCPSTSTIGRIIAGAHDKMRMIPVRLSARGKARLIKKRSVKPRRPKQYRPVKTGELIGMDAIELRMGDLRRYIITMIDEHSDYALALAVPSLNSDITSHFFSKATKLFPVAIRQVVTDNGKEFLGNFDKTLQEASIKHIWTYPYTPKMNATCERFNRTLREQFIEFNELLLFEDLNLFNQRMAEYLVLYNSKRPHKSLELMTPVDYILRESKNCNMWWTHTRWGLPFNFLLFSVVTVVIVSGTQSLFGKMITDPIETVSRVGNDLAVAIGLLTMITATIGINIVANFVSPAFDFSNCAPQKISFRTGGMIAAVGSILLTPWNLFNSPELIHYTLDVLGAFIGPLFGILIADFYLIKRGRVSVDDLFDDTPQGKYWYRNGFNPKAIAALLPSVGLGLIISFIPALHEVANFSWFIGVFLGATAYRWLARDEREVQAKAAFRSGAVAQKE